MRIIRYDSLPIEIIEFIITLSNCKISKNKKAIYRQQNQKTSVVGGCSCKLFTCRRSDLVSTEPFGWSILWTVVSTRARFWLFQTTRFNNFTKRSNSQPYNKCDLFNRRVKRFLVYRNNTIFVRQKSSLIVLVFCSGARWSETWGLLINRNFPFRCILTTLQVHRGIGRRYGPNGVLETIFTILAELAISTKWKCPDTRQWGLRAFRGNFLYPYTIKTLNQNHYVINVFEV